MKQFVIRILFFTSLCTVIIAFAIVFTGLVIDRKADFISKKHLKYVVLGHSHPECAFNDSLIKDLSNFACSGEAYFYTFLKARKLLEQKDEIEAVFIEYSNNQINESMNNWIWDEMHLNAYSIYSPFMKCEDHKVLFTNNISGYIMSLSVALKENIYRTVKNDYKYEDIGGYKHLDRANTDSILKKSSPNEDVNMDLNKFSITNVEYLEKLILLCKEKGKKVFLIRSPLHLSYPGIYNEKFFQKIRKSRFSKIEFLDFKNFPLSNSEFGDLEHLNYRGARKFSLWFDKLLKDSLLSEPKMQDFIEKKIKELQND